MINKPYFFVSILRPGFMAGLAAPKIPEGEKVDFDVGSVLFAEIVG